MSDDDNVTIAVTVSQSGAPLTHYERARLYLDGNGTTDDELKRTPDVVLQYWTQQAQVHATLALVDQLASLQTQLRQQQRAQRRER